MNSLTYITRQLDHSASYDRLPQLDTREAGSSHLRRSETWSKPFHFRRRGKKSLIAVRDSSEDSSEDSYDPRPLVSQRQTSQKAKRSFSSPALLKGSSVIPSILSSCSTTPLSIPKNIPSPPSPCPLPVASTSEPVDKESYLYRRLRRLSLVQAFTLIWHTLCATYVHIIPHPSFKQVNLLVNVVLSLNAKRMLKDRSII
jgi:hypothetical protein